MSETDSPRVVVVATLSDFGHRVGHHGESDAIAWAIERREQALLRLAATGAVAHASDPLGIVAVCADPVDGVLASLCLGPGWSVGLAASRNASSDAPSFALHRALGLAHQRRGDVSTDESVAERLVPPEGIGIYRAPEPRESLLGHPVYVIGDYRSS